MKIGMRIVNAVPLVVLRSPFRHLLSGRHLVLQFTGRTSGRRYTTPVAYARTAEGVLISTDSPWWRNLVARPQVHLQLRGRRVPATARLLEDPQEAVAGLAQLVDDVPGYWRPAGLVRTDGVVTHQTLTNAVDGGRRVLLLQVAQ